MTIVSRVKKKKHESSIWQIILLLLVLPSVLRAKNTLECNDFVKNDKCTCYIFEEAIFLDCQDSNTKEIKNTLKRVMNVHSLSIYDLDDTEEVLGPHFLPFGICIKHIHLSRTNIRIIDDETFATLRQCLETLSIMSNLANLKELNVLYLGFNNIKYISVTAFNNLNKIIQIGLEHNKLHMIPIELFLSIETHIQDISIKDNVIICSCQKNNTWTWIQDHPKIIQTNDVTCHNDEYPKEKCDFPILTQMSIDKHKDNSVSISWFIRNRTAVKSLQILYYDDDLNSGVTYRYIDKTETSTLISDLKPSRNYIICILTLDRHPLTQTIEEEITTLTNFSSDINFTSNMSRSVAAILISQSSSSECISFDTFSKQTVKLSYNKNFNLSTILNRRMGLIVGCSLGFVVFFIMVSVLLYTKIKERKRIAKSDPAWSEMNDYHSIQSKEDILQHSITASTDNILLGIAKN
ncbi:unnamed protein product [Parnassius apollo]|uniref:(apollo) hypothetical protein n=1 Tax=Parnassius apollo TaxID=110799 RepID=A0A8S3X022_PARAO|nr:unnamed protein product [Parnassius apollo]